MRPFRHETAREDRTVLQTLPIDTRLRNVWEDIGRLHGSRLAYDVYRCSYNALMPLHASLDELHHLILTTPQEHDHYPLLGAFVTAGYQLLPEREIEYDLHTPNLRYLGAFLRHKHLIINGSVGCNAGHEMIGRLTNNGQMKINGGNRMVGLLRNNGTAEDLGDMMIGVIENYGTFSMICGRMMLGNNCGIWNVQEHQRASFLVDITNPLRADFRWLHDSLLKKYGLWE